jgi:hypothetical protein
MGETNFPITIRSGAAIVISTIKDNWLKSGTPRHRKAEIINTKTEQITKILSWKTLFIRLCLKEIIPKMNTGKNKIKRPSSKPNVFLTK